MSSSNFHSPSIKTNREIKVVSYAYLSINTPMTSRIGFFTPQIHLLWNHGCFPVRLTTYAPFCSMLNHSQPVMMVILSCDEKANLNFPLKYTHSNCNATRFKIMF